MNKKQKIIIFLSSLFCGSPIIFLSLKNNQKKIVVNQQKEEKEKNNEDQQKSSSSFLFWTVLIVIIIFGLIIIFGTIYKHCQKSKGDKNGQHDDKATILLDAKEKLKFSFFISKKDDSIAIIFRKDYKDKNDEWIKYILRKDIDDRKPLPIKNDFYSKDKIGVAENYFSNILKYMVWFLQNYLTAETLIVVYQDFQKNKIKYGILTNMANIFVKSKKDDQITLYVKTFINKSKAANNDEVINKINGYEYIKLFNIIIKSDQLTAIAGNDNIFHILFEFLFNFYKLFDEIYNCLETFLQQKGEGLRKDIKNTRESIDNYISTGVLNDLLRSKFSNE